jgi:hypothetical protein
MYARLTMVVPAPVFVSKNATLTASNNILNGLFYYMWAFLGKWLVIFGKSSIMKKLFSLLVMIMILNSCAQLVVVDSKPKKAPPGQVKKVTGSQSAKPYAPGQQKKKN